MKKIFTLMTLLVAMVTNAWGVTETKTETLSFTGKKETASGSFVTATCAGSLSKQNDYLGFKKSSTMTFSSSVNISLTKVEISFISGKAPKENTFTATDGTNNVGTINAAGTEWTGSQAISSSDHLVITNATSSTNDTQITQVKVTYTIDVTYPQTGLLDFANCNPTSISTEVDNLQGAAKSRYVSTTSSYIKMYADVASGKINYRSANNDAQFNGGTILQISVNSITDVVTVTPRSVSGDGWTLGDKTITTATATDYTAKMRDIDQGYVSLTSTGGYLTSVQVVQNAKATTPALMKFTTAGGTTFYADELEWVESPSGTFTANAKQPGTETLVSSSSPLASSAAYVGTVAPATYDGNTATITVKEDATTYTYVINFSLLADRTVTYYDVDGTSSLGTQIVADGAAIGTFPYSATPDAGYAFRDWFTGSNGTGTKVTTETVVTGGDMNVYAYQSVIETANDTETYTFDLTTTAFNADYHEAFVAHNGAYHNSHGWLFGSSSSVDLLIGGNSQIKIGLCAYSSEGNMTITYPDGSTSDPVSVKAASDGDIYTFTYTGGTAGTATVNFPSSGAYIHSIQIVNAGAYITPAKEYTTYITTKDLDFANAIPAGLTAYKATAADGTGVTLISVDQAPAGTPLVLKGTAETVYTVPAITSATPVTGNKLLRGDGTTVFDGSTFDYMLKDGKFCLITSGAIATDKAYLHLESNPAGARTLDLNIGGGGATGIETIKVGTEDNVYYDLQGRRVLYPTKGLYIVNGKKVIIK